MKEYKDLDKIKIGNATNDITEGTLCLEGGAFRGIYTAGVLDFLMENGINLRTAIGVSAGALNGMSYISGNMGRNAYCDLKHRHNKRWIGKRHIFKDGGIVNFNFYFTDLQKEIPFNYDRLYNQERKLISVVTNMRTGKPEYFDNHNSLILKATKASSSMPFVSEPVKILDQKYLDGGCATKLPIRYALEKGYKKIVFVGTRPMTFRRELNNKGEAITKLKYRKYPKFVEAMKNTDRLYNEDMDLIADLEKKGEIFTICPSKYIEIDRLETDLDKLASYYWLGYNDCKDKLSELKKYLDIE